eukprot:2011287-Prymnesium_polylepis.1
MTKGCDTAQVRSGEPGRHAVYLQSAVQRLESRGLKKLRPHYCPRSHGASDVVGTYARTRKECE